MLLPPMLLLLLLLLPLLIPVLVPVPMDRRTVTAIPSSKAHAWTRALDSSALRSRSAEEEEEEEGEGEGEEDGSER